VGQRVEDVPDVHAALSLGDGTGEGGPGEAIGGEQEGDGAE